MIVAANPRAGAIRHLDESVEVLRGAGRDVVTVEPGDGPGLAEALEAHPEATVVAAGGDGTLHSVVQQLASAGALGDVVVGLLPLGTGNDFARTVGIPLDPVSAASVVLEGSPRRLDLLVDGAGDVAVNAVHAGIGGLAAARAAPLKPLLGGAAYRVGAAVAGARSRGWRVRVEVDGQPLVEDRLLLVGLGNGATVGGGTVLWPGASPDDGLVEVVVAVAGGIVSRLRLAGGLRRGDPAGVDGVLLARGRSVRVEGDALPYNTDGEVSAARSSRTWMLQPRAWRLLVPGGR